ncbi:zinc finger protein CONSTANS-LIKE 4 isoform X2 [Malania oleifera]|uniref:zinc finger protein CONSTANS-LIKE 4 isoform X2 n=1 Tax=Malania oleifera TaxID=397392 RepID=UPI0025ADFD0E|nr:zinc finger protein CONSTANS-LIKE 4 isoform X2 [Malania oleifera]
MYAETGLLFPYFQNFSQEVHPFEDFCRFQKPNAPMGNLIQTSTVSEYDLGGEGDLFKAPEPIIEDPLAGLDPMTAAISMISCGDEVIPSQALEVAESIQNEQLLSEVLYECEKDLLAEAAAGTPLPEILDNKIPVASSDRRQLVEEKLLSEGPVQKSVSSGCLSSMEWISGAPVRPNFLDFPGMDFGAVYGMRRAFSEGDIKRSCNSEERRQKLSRYRNKKTKRNFGRKIKYACRKALADSQPRIRGRFAKTEESDISKKQ